MLFATDRGPSKAESAKGAANKAAQEPAQPAGDNLYGALFQTATESLAVWRLLKDKRGKPCDVVFVAANLAYTQLFGIADPAGRKASEFDPHLRERDPDIVELCAQVAATGVPEIRESYYPLLDRWFEVRISPGATDHVLAAFEDITERRRTEESLLQTQISVDHAADMIIWADSKGRLVYSNQSLAHRLGYSREEIQSLYLWDIAPELSEEQYLSRWVDGVGPEPLRHEAALRTKDGRVFPVEVASASVDISGRILGIHALRDITGRVQTEESLLLTQLSVDNSADLVHWADSEGRLVYANQSMVDSLGYSREELLSLHIWDVVPELSQELFRSRWTEGLGKEPFRHEGTLKTKDGMLIPIEVSSNAVELKGRTLGVHSARDISERKEADRQLRESETRYRNLFELESDALLLVDDESGELLEVNEAATTLYGYSRDELLAMKNTDLSAEPDETRLASLEPVIRVPLRWHRKKDGTVFPVESRGRHLEWKGRPVHLVALNDITERRRTEESLLLTKLSVDQAADMIHWLDPDGRIVYSNRASQELLGYTPEEMQTLHVWDLDPTVSPDSWPQQWAHVAAEAPLLGEGVLIDKDGRRHSVEISSNYVRYEGKEYGVALLRDTTERRRIEESLRLTQFSVDNAPDLIHWLDPEGYIVYANRATCERLGYSREELRGMHIWDVSPSGTAEAFERRWVPASEGDVFLHEETMRTKDGRGFVVEIASKRFRHEGKEVAIAFARDISEGKRAEQSLRDSEERYHELFELETDAIVLAEDDSRSILEVNGAAATLYGYSRAELLAMKDTDLFADAERIPLAAGVSAVDPALHWHRKKDGTVFPVETRGRHFEWNGQPVHVAAIRDISERKRGEDELEESRQMLRLVLDTVPLRIAWRDRDLRYMGCNAAFARDIHLPDPEAIVGLKEEELPLFNTAQSARDDDREVMATGVPKLQYEESVTTSDGSSSVFLTSKVPLRDRSGQIIGVLGVHEDVTERTQTLKALRDRDEQLRQSQKMEAVGRLAGGIAHDFNNVLTTIVGYSDLILSSPNCPEGSLAEDIGEIKAAAERAGSLTRQILAFSRRQALQPTVLSLNTVVFDTERLLARTLGADVELRMSLSPDLGSVEVDEQQFVQVLLNLAVNARDAMPKGGVLTLETANVDLDKLFCETHPDAHPGPYVMLAVSDTGTGMDPDTLAHAFEPFYTTKPPGEGTGLGLSTVYGVVAQSGGCTYARSEPGQGTAFIIYFPRVESGPAPQENVASSPKAEGGPRTIMVVEDDATYRGLTTRILERRGYRVLPASDGDQAAAVLEDQAAHIDLLLTDLVLPGSLQGEEVARLAVDKRPGLSVLFMSSHPRDTMVQAGRIDEKAAYLERPFTAEELAGRVRTSLSKT